MLNFLIAVISNVYDSVTSKKEMLMYTQRAEINKEFFMLKKFFKLTKSYNFIIFSFTENDEQEEEDDFVGFVQNIKDFTSNQSLEIQDKIDGVMNEIKNNCASTKQIQNLENKFKDLQQTQRLN